MIGIVTPTLNSEKYLKFTIDSIKKLKKDDICKYLIIDGGSIDKTLKICSENDLEVFSLPKGNMYKAINFGLRKFDVEWLTYINSDDILNAEMVIDAINKYGDSADIIYGDTKYIDSRGDLIYTYKGANISLFDGIFLKGYLPFSQPGTIIRSNVFSKLGGFSEKYKYASDLDFFISAYLNGVRFKRYEKECLASFRIHGNQITKVHRKDMKVEIQDILKNYKNKLNVSYCGLDIYINKFINIRSYFSRCTYSINKYLLKIYDDK